MNKLFSIVVPVYGNEKNIPVTVPYMIENLNLFEGYEVELLFICDGSPDNSYEALKPFKREYPSIIRIVDFTKNFNQGAAIHCGCDLAKGDVIGVISCDMQDPFDLFVDMLAAWEDGYKLVVATRVRRSDGFLSDLASKTYHRIINKYVSSAWPKGGFDFFLMDREVAERYTEVDCLNTSMQMTLLWPGYEYKLLEYERNERRIGKSGYSFWKKVRVSLGTITSFSSIASGIWGIVGLTALVLSVFLLVLTVCSLCFGWSELLALFLGVSCVMFLNTGLVLIAVCAVGEYVWRTYHRTLDRPRYVIREME